MISLKYITSLAFSQLCGASGGCKKTQLYISLQANIIGGKKTNKMSSVALFDPQVFSSQLGLPVCGVIFWSGHTITTFLLAFKNQKYMVLVKNFIFFNSTTVKLCVSIEWVSKFAFYVAQGARENGWLPTSEAGALGRCWSITLCKQIIELNYKISLAYIVCFKINLSW